MVGFCLGKVFLIYGIHFRVLTQCFFQNGERQRPMVRLKTFKKKIADLDNSPSDQNSGEQDADDDEDEFQRQKSADVNWRADGSAEDVYVSGSFLSRFF